MAVTNLADYWIAIEKHAFGPIQIIEMYYLVQIKSPRDDIKSPFGIRLIENSNFL